MQDIKEYLEKVIVDLPTAYDILKQRRYLAKNTS